MKHHLYFMTTIIRPGFSYIHGLFVYNLKMTLFIFVPFNLNSGNNSV